ncbi:ral guanine nucleotide dissociation stimulator-like 1 isoform X3 [Tyto alba]|uniref:ral guanine nucleotide dissociation stimulator-like 1 isoform X3 n=1 Tax=Tyto alba TaxID=56313 RepID=UPI001C67EB9F|nr:ral guanine nucleotide dissociation stimulator-like 1 isoform X3 [Tyto alba]
MAVESETSTIQDWGEEAEEGAVYHVTLKRVQIHQAANKGARWLGAGGDQLPPEHTVSQYETRKIRTIKAGTLEKLVENLPTAFGDNDFTYISIFLSTYRAFASTKEVLELLLDKYGNLEISSYEEAGDQNSSESNTVLRTAIASILRAWLDQCPEDFREPPNYPCLLKLLDYLKSNIPGSDPERRAQKLLEQFQNQEVENDDGFRNTSPCNLYDEEELEISTPEEFSFFQEDLVAEQLTYMDAKLFKQVVPHHCLGCIWSQRDKKENKNLAPTIRATISQFNAVTKCVISTVLKDKELKTQQRAKIIEKWIHIAHECRILKNFSSLRAIISALQSNSIYRLKKTWGCVSKDIMLIFEELSDIFSDHDNYLTSRELLMKEGTSKFANLDSSVKENQKRTRRRLQLQKYMGLMQGTVPYLGTFLTDLIMLDTALQDYTEGGLINFEKRRKEFEVIAQIKLLQSACNSYCMTPDQKFIRWFRRQEHLTEEESYSLSCEIEAAADTSTMFPKSRKSMVKRLSQLFLGSEVLTHSTPTKEQPKCAPSGSSGESTDSASVSSLEFNQSETEDAFTTPMGTPEEPQKKLPEEPSSSFSSIFSLPSSSSSCTYSIDTSSSGVSSPVQSSPSLSSNNKRSDKRSDKFCDNCSDKCSDKRSVSAPPILSQVLPPVDNQQKEDTCVIRISTENNNDNIYKSILITNQEKTPAVIQRAMAKHNLESDTAEDYELVQVISRDKELVIPSNANVFYAMNSRVSFNFLLRKKSSVNKQVKMRSWSSLTFPRTAKQGCRSDQPSKITL